jgi:ATP-dependent DNA helicase RecG
MQQQPRTPTDIDLIRMFNAGESDRVEFKESFAGRVSRTVREAACAFANDLPGHNAPGVVFIGVRDDGSNAGIPISDELLRNLVDVKTDGHILPPPSIDVRKLSTPIGELAALIVWPSPSPPVRYNGRVHIRIGARRNIASAQDELILNERRRFKDLPFDVQPVPSARVSDLNLTYFEHEYLPSAYARDVLDANERSIEERLAATKMIASVDEQFATVLGILVLGKNPQDFLPGAYVQFLKFGGANPSDQVEDNEDIRGGVSDIIRRLDEKFRSHNRIAVDATSSETELRTALYPIAALQQITRNAIMHRTYEATNAPVHVRWFADRIEVVSPGGAFGVVNAGNFGSPGVVDYRNPNLAESLRNLGFVQRFGIGIQIVHSELEEAGHPPATFHVDQNALLATIPANPKLIG